MRSPPGLRGDDEQRVGRLRRHHAGATHTECVRSLGLCRRPGRGRQDPPTLPHEPFTASESSPLGIARLLVGLLRFHRSGVIQGPQRGLAADIVMLVSHATGFPSSVVRPFTTLPLSPVANTASADFCQVKPHRCLCGRRADRGSRGRHPDRPPRIRTVTFALRPPHLRCDPLVMTD
jgi:hypothetical protein